MAREQIAQQLLLRGFVAGQHALELLARTTSLTQHGLEVYLCKVTFATLKIDLAKARTDSYIRLVPSGIATASALQSKGYSYLKVG